jgi:glucokinase
LDDCVRVWSAGIVSLVHAYDPELVVVGGGVMQSASLLLPKFISYVHEHAWTPWGKVEIRAALLGDDASLLGAAPLWEDPAL